MSLQVQGGDRKVMRLLRGASDQETHLHMILYDSKVMKGRQAETTNKKLKMYTIKGFSATQSVINVQLCTSSLTKPNSVIWSSNDAAPHSTNSTSNSEFCEVSLTLLGLKNNYVEFLLEIKEQNKNHWKRKY